MYRSLKVITYFTTRRLVVMNRASSRRRRYFCCILAIRGHRWSLIKFLPTFLLWTKDIGNIIDTTAIHLQLSNRGSFLLENTFVFAYIFKLGLYFMPLKFLRVVRPNGHRCESPENILLINTVVNNVTGRFLQWKPSVTSITPGKLECALTCKMQDMVLDCM